MTVNEALQWLNGKRVAICEPDAAKFSALETLLKSYGLMVSHFNTAEEVLNELQRQQYATQSVFLAILVDYDLARSAVDAWEKVTDENPTILQTPLVLMRQPDQVAQAQDMLDKGLFEFELNSPVDKMDLYHILTELKRWKAWQSDMQDVQAKPSAMFEED